MKPRLYISKSPLIKTKGISFLPSSKKGIWFTERTPPKYSPMTWWQTTDGTRLFILVGVYVCRTYKKVRVELREAGLKNGIYVDYDVFDKSINEGLYLPFTK